MYLKLRNFLQAFILENQVFIRFNMLNFFNMLNREVSEMGLRFFKNLLMSYNYVIAMHDRSALFLKCLFLIIK